MKRVPKMDKLAEFFGVNLVELEDSAMKKALDQLEPSGTYFELSGPPQDEASPFFCMHSILTPSLFFVGKILFFSRLMDLWGLRRISGQVP